MNDKLVSERVEGERERKRLKENEGKTKSIHETLT
jgi:hypothetical protein